LTIAGGVNDAGSPYYVTALTTAGDVNGDGYGDLVVGTYEVGVGGADVSIQLFLGGPASLAPIPAVSLTFEANLWGVAGVAGDVNGDGYGDLVVPLDSPVFAGVPRDFVVDELYPGGPSGWPAAPAVFATQVSTDPQPDYPLGLADVNGDGYADLPVLSDYSAAAGGGGALCSYLGGASGFLPTPLCTGAVSSTDGFATGGIATVGDVNGDGYADVLAGGNVYLGGPDGLAATPSAAAPYGVIYADVVSAGDLDGDGYSDIAVLLAGHVDVYRGGPGGLAGVPAATLLAVDDAGDKGVYAVYGATN
jgi:hypothetical protein